MLSIGPNMTEISELKQALNTTQIELAYEMSSRIVDGITTDEETRRLRVKIHIIEDEIEELNEQLVKEEERSDGLAQDLDDALARSDELDVENQTLSNEMRVKSRELDNAKAELSAMNDMSNDTSKVLREKLALARELSTLKPELEHLRSQAAANQDLLAEKLSLQRQLSTVQVELDNAKRTAERAVSKAGKATEQDDERDSQIEELKQQLRETKKAETENSKEMDCLRRELAGAKKQAERVAARDTEGEGLTKFKSQVEEMRKELTTEKKERQRVEKGLEKAQAGWEAEKSTLNDKLATFRAKLKSTKEKLRESEASLQKTEEQLAARPAGTEKPAKNPRKRQVAQMDPDAMIGTPGDMAPAKRGKRANITMPGDKSTFSITPFLNRTMSLAPESPPSQDEVSEAEKDKEIEAETEAPAEGTPSAPPKKDAKNTAAAKSKKPLALASSAKQNRKPAAPRRTKSAVSTLEMVTEEEENTVSQKKHAEEVKADTEIPTSKEIDYKETTTTTKVPAQLVPKLKPTSKQPRKSLMSFATFTDEPPAEKKKKRKLLGSNSSSGFGKTLFDEDDEKPVAKPIPGRGLFANRVLGKGSIFAGKKALKGPLVTADDGFQFSPLKKDRKAAILAQSMLGD